LIETLDWNKTWAYRPNRAYRRGDRRRDDRLFNRATNWRSSRRRSLRPVAATIASCIRLL